MVDFQEKELTETIISCFYKVYNTLGYGFLEKVYENALLIELKLLGLDAKTQYPIRVLYNGSHVGEYFADILVENKVIVELKACSSMSNDHVLQLQNYLKATNIEIGLLLNFGINPEIRRKNFSNSSKVFENPKNPDHPVHP